MRNILSLLIVFAIPLTAMSANIVFSDSQVKALCVGKWDSNGDGELSEEEASAVTSLGDVFSFNKDIISFTELSYFTGLDNIESYAFYNCKNLLKIQFPAQISKISTSAFFDCSSLRAVTIPKSVKTISEYAFNGCSGMTSLTLGESVTSIGEYAFCNCRSFAELVIPASVTKIALSSFWGCSSLSTIIVDPGNTMYDSREDCNAIVVSTTNTILLGTSSTTFPESVTAIGESAFYGNSKLESIHIPESIVSIGVSAFSGCSSLTSVTLPFSFTSISDGLFSGCSKLKNILLPPNLKTIGSNAFERCSSLSKIKLPASLTSIAYGAFLNCSKMLKVSVERTTPISILSNTFPYAKLSTLYVPKGCLSAYQNATYWKNFKAIQEMPENVVTASVTPDEIRMRASTTLSLSLSNDDFNTYRSLQMDVVLPEGFSVVNGSISSSERCPGMTSTVLLLEDGSFRVTCASDNSSINGTTGEIFTLQMKASNEVSKGDYKGTLENISLTSDLGETLPIPATEFSWSVVANPLGDVNLDGFVNVSDIMIVVNYILGNEVNSTVELMDINQDSRVTVTDVMQIVNIILSIEN